MDISLIIKVAGVGILISILNMLLEKTDRKDWATFTTLAGEVMQIIGIAIISTALCLVIKKDRPEIAMFIGILTGVIILTSVIFKLGFIIESINDLANKANIPSVYITLIIKLIGIAYLMEFAIQLCKDCGEGNIASKLEFGGKIIVMTMSFPILLSIVEMVLNIIP